MHGIFTASQLLLLWYEKKDPTSHVWPYRHSIRCNYGYRLQLCCRTSVPCWWVQMRTKQAQKIFCPWLLYKCGVFAKFRWKHTANVISTCITYTRLKLEYKKLCKDTIIKIRLYWLRVIVINVVTILDVILSAATCLSLVGSHARSGPPSQYPSVQTHAWINSYTHEQNTATDALENVHPGGLTIIIITVLSTCTHTDVMTVVYCRYTVGIVLDLIYALTLW